MQIRAAAPGSAARPARAGRLHAGRRHQGRGVGKLVAGVVEIQRPGQRARIERSEVIDRPATDRVDRHRAKSQNDPTPGRDRGGHERPPVEPGAGDQRAEHPALERPDFPVGGLVLFDRKLVVHRPVEAGEAKFGFFVFVVAVVVIARFGFARVGRKA